MRMLLIEDDVDLAATTAEYLAARGHEVEFAYDGRTGLQLATMGLFDCIVLDLALPAMDGLEVCRTLRRESREQPILMLTARDTLEDKLKGFEAGADDYLVKPFELAELVARVGALQRRAQGPAEGKSLRVGDLVIEPSLGRASRNGQPLALHRIGMEILTLLARASPHMVAREELERAIWGSGALDRDLLRSHLYLIRRAVDRPFDLPLLHTIRGRGVRLGVLEDPA